MQQLLLIYTGGTIGMIEDEQSGILKPFNFDNLLQQIPQLQRINAQIHTLSVENPKDSADMHPADWQTLGKLIHDNYNTFDAFVILHGTDTMAYTATAMSFMFQNLSKPIIFTGSQLPIGNIRTDAVENVLTAIQLALLQKNGKPQINEVGLYFGSQLLRANRSSKLSSSQFNAFSSPNYPVLATSGVSLQVTKEVLLTKKEKELVFNLNLKEDVFLLKIHPGIKQQHFESLLNAIDFKVLVLETYGSGTLFTDQWFLDALAVLRNKNKIVINCTQCFEGGVEEAVYASSKILNDLGVISAKNMTTEAVLVKSMCILGYKNEFLGFKNEFERSFSGEIS